MALILQNEVRYALLKSTIAGQLFFHSVHRVAEVERCLSLRDSDVNDLEGTASRGSSELAPNVLCLFVRK